MSLARAEEAFRRGAQQKPEELDQFEQILRDFFELTPLTRVLEVGSLRGGMLWWFREVLDPDVLVSVDAEDNLEDQNRENVVVITGNSNSSETAARAAGHGLYNLIFIDGDHRYEGVKADWERYQVLLGRPGIIAFHDIKPHLPEFNSGVDRFWEELKPELPRWEEVVFPSPGPACGIGIAYFD